MLKNSFVALTVTTDLLTVIFCNGFMEPLFGIHLDFIIINRSESG